MYALGELGASEKTKKKRKRRRALLKKIGIGAGIATVGVAAVMLAPALLPGAAVMAKTGASGLLATGGSVVPDIAKTLMTPESPKMDELNIPPEIKKSGRGVEASIFGISPILLFTMGAGLLTMFFYGGKGRN